MLSILKIVFSFVLFLILYSLVEYLYFKNNKQIQEARGEYKKGYSAFQSIKDSIEKNDRAKDIIQKKDESLKKLGNPLKLNGFSYYMYKLFIIVLFVMFLISGNVTSFLTVSLAAAAFLPDIMIKSIAKKERLEILGDLPNISDVLNIQSGAAGMDIGTALTEAFDIAKCKRLKEKLIELSIEISLTKNIPSALDKFSENFDLSEVDSFVIALKQAVSTGRSKDLLDSQSELLKDAAMAKVSLKTKEISVWIGLVAGFIFLGLAVLILYSFGIQLMSSFKEIF